MHPMNKKRAACWNRPKRSWTTWNWPKDKRTRIFWTLLPIYDTCMLLCHGSTYSVNVLNIYSTFLKSFHGYTEPSMVAGKQSGRNHVHHARIQKASKNPQAQLMDVELCNSKWIYSPHPWGTPPAESRSGKKRSVSDVGRKQRKNSEQLSSSSAKIWVRTTTEPVAASYKSCSQGLQAKSNCTVQPKWWRQGKWCKTLTIWAQEWECTFFYCFFSKL